MVTLSWLEVDRQALIGLWLGLDYWDSNPLAKEIKLVGFQPSVDIEELASKLQIYIPFHSTGDTVPLQKEMYAVSR